MSEDKPQLPDKAPHDPTNPEEPLPLPPDTNPEPAPIREPDQPPPIRDPIPNEPTRLRSIQPVISN
jgi:hypothetical protein